MYECFHCLQKTVIWDSDFDLEDIGEEGEGVVSLLSLHTLRCRNTVYREKQQ